MACEEARVREIISLDYDPPLMASLNYDPPLTWKIFKHKNSDTMTHIREQCLSNDVGGE